MLHLCSEQLDAHLNTELNSVYFLFGNNCLLLHESHEAIRQSAIIQGFREYYSFQLDKNTDWQEIFSLCQTIGLFSKRKVLQITLPESNSVNVILNEKMLILVSLLHKDLLLILRGSNLAKVKKSAWFRKLVSYLVIVDCQMPEKEKLLRWIATRAKKNQLQIDEAACQLLCYYCEGNLLALAQELDQLKLLWPDGKLTFPRVKKMIKDSALFTPFHWIDALLEANLKRTLHVLRHLRLEGSEPAILLRILQRELLLLINLKHQLENHQPLHTLFDKLYVWKSRRTMITTTLNRLSQDQLRQAVHLLTRIELILKQNQKQSVWLELENLSFLLCHQSLAKVFIDG